MKKNNTIEEYREGRNCPKCHNTYVTTTFDQQGDYPTGNIIRKCGRCGYWWYEKPLDSSK